MSFTKAESFGYVTSTHQAGRDYGPTILTYYYPMAEEDLRTGMTKLLALDWKELADICLTDMAQAHPDIRQLTERIDIMRWGHAMISPRTGFVWNGEREKASKPFRKYTLCSFRPKRNRDLRRSVLSRARAAEALPVHGP